MGLFVKIILVIILLNSFILNAQRKSSDKKLTKEQIEQIADESLQLGKFERALVLYKRLLANDVENSKLNFLIGYCYINTDYGKETSIKYLEKSIDLIKPGNKNNAPIEVFYYLSKAYYINNKFSKAIETLDTSINKIPKYQPQFKEKAKNLKEHCENVLVIIKSNVNLEIKSIIDINSKYSDYNPLICNSNNEIFYTSRRAINKNSKKNIDGQYDENIYMSNFINNAWQKPEILSNNINTIYHEKACFVSENNSTMIIRRIDKHKGSLYISVKNNVGKWTIAKKLGQNINTKHQETHGSLSPNGQTLFFISDRKGTQGGTDIFVSEKLKDGTWGKAKNLGNKINSIFDEETPYLHKNGTLFFASKGHNSIGGFDIFASTKDSSGNWSEPINMGIPINSVFDDFGYIPNKKGTKAYYSSNKKGGKGESDIFEVVLDTNSRNDYIAVFGELKFKSNQLRKNTRITVIEDYFKDTLFNLVNIPKSGKYQFVIKAGKKYEVIYSFDNTIIHKNVIDSKQGGSILVLDQLVFVNDIAIHPKTNVQYYKNIAVNSFKTDYIISKPISNEIVFSSLIGFNNNTDTTTTITTEIDKKGIIYSIKLTDSEKKQNISNFSNIKGVKEHNKNNNIYTYYVGEYIYEWEAEIKLRKIKDKYPNAKIFINKFVN